MKYPAVGSLWMCQDAVGIRRTTRGMRAWWDDAGRPGRPSCTEYTKSGDIMFVLGEDDGLIKVIMQDGSIGYICPSWWDTDIINDRKGLLRIS